MTIPFLSTDRLDLEALGDHHLSGPYISWLNDSVICQFNRHHRLPYTYENALQYLHQIALKSDLVLAVIERSSGAHIGNIALENFDKDNQTAEYAILMGDQTKWGRGLATEASECLFRHGFEALQLHRIYAATLIEHVAMRNLAKRLGMVEEGVRRSAIFKAGRYHDVIEFGLLSDEWLGRNSSPV